MNLRENIIKSNIHIAIVTHYSHDVPYLDSNGPTLCLTFAIRNSAIPQSPITSADTINNTVYIYYYNGCNDDKGNGVMMEDIVEFKQD